MNLAEIIEGACLIECKSKFPLGEILPESNCPEAAPGAPLVTI